jgi:osmoprotectant transport system substrate-binding protein
VTQRRRSSLATVLAGALALALTASCTGNAAAPSRTPAPAAVVVASFNFPESTLIGEIYAQAMEAEGIPVRRELSLGTRELVQPALFAGMVDVVPEYLGSALASVEPGADIASDDGEGLRRRLAGALTGRGFQVLTAAEAQDQNGLVLTRAGAKLHGVSSISDLAPVASQLRLGGPPECPQRQYCLRGLEQAYGLHFGAFVPLATEQQRATALADDVVDVAVMFTTDGRLASGDLVLLEDDRKVQPIDSVVPVVSMRSIERYGPRLVVALDRVSSRLTAGGLTFLNWRVDVEGKDIVAEARGWLQRQSLVPRPG